MHHCRRHLLSLLVLVTITSQVGAAPAVRLRTVPRKIPKILPDHPGNVFGRGETVIVATPAEYRGKAASWRATDIARHEIASAKLAGTCDLGALPIGWYRIDFLDGTGKSVGWTSCAVIEGPSLPTADNSPICVDSATAWFARGDQGKREGFAYLASVARVNWIRDRLSWGEMEPEQGQFAKPGNIYDAAIEAQAEQGLNVLQVFHSSPKWARDNRLDGAKEPWKRFPRDLRHLYSFTQGVARRYSGKVLAWEPWNEANITAFGGHTIDEMCTLQKAAYFGIKSGSPHATVCWNVYAGAGSELHTQGVLRNEVWPYFETYNIHSYSPTQTYGKAFEGARDAASGRPIWISECGIRLQTKTEKPWGELGRIDELLQAQFLPRSYAASLYAGVDRHFFFILGNYLERGTQFGLLRHDLTPRPGYVALAATGRFLASARCLGKLAGDGYEMVAFAARPDGQSRTVLVGWSETPQPLPLDGIRPEAVYDCYGRTSRPRLGTDPRFIILPDGALSQLKLTPPPKRADPRPGKPCPIVLQTQFRKSTRWLHGQAHRLPAGVLRSVPLNVYNFSGSAARGRLSLADAPKGWKITVPPGELVIPPGEALETSLRLQLPRAGEAVIEGGWVTLTGAFGHLGTSVLSFRLAGDVASLKPVASTPLASAAKRMAWTMNINKGATMSAEAGLDGAVVFTMEFGESDPWAYPFLTLPEEEIPGEDYDGVSMTVQLLEGKGEIRCQFTEEGGASYLGELSADDSTRRPQQVTALFRYATWGPYSKEDANGKLNPGQIRRLLVGINAKPKSRVRLLVRDLRWVKF